MNEASKAMRRRWDEDHTDTLPFKWFDLFRGNGVDVGCGPDKIPLPDCRGFDGQDGDANQLSNYFLPESLDYIHGSQCLEHMHNPREALLDWLKALKPGGYIIQTVPDWGSYERFRWPSVTNPDHKSTWSMIYLGSPAPHHVHLPTFLPTISGTSVLLCRYVERNFDWKLPIEIDQTWEERHGVEVWNEFVLKKS